ncbi:MAG: GFA family protein [Deltaproteobacteria bacterium]|nr:MAG: GFA family protein [Deltaproteobacteria bacterium]
MNQHYQGSCHCGRVTFELDCDLTTAVRCNCSICRRKGVPMLLAAEGTFRLTKGEDCLSLYQFHTGRARHYFCKVCGVYTHHNPRSNPQQVRVNAGCLEGVDPLALSPKLIDGASFD